MVFDEIAHAADYQGLGEGIQKGLAFLRDTDFSALPDGKHEIDGERVYAVVRTYDTKPQKDCRWEAHKKYIDIQSLAEGSEWIGFAFLEGLKQTTGYDADKDIYYLKGDEQNGVFAEMKPGRFMIFWPQDAHMPEISKGGGAVRKVVVKVLEEAR